MVNMLNFMFTLSQLKKTGNEKSLPVLERKSSLRNLGYIAMYIF